MNNRPTVPGSTGTMTEDIGIKPSPFARRIDQDQQYQRDHDRRQGGKWHREVFTVAAGETLDPSAVNSGVFRVSHVRYIVRPVMAGGVCIVSVWDGIFRNTTPDPTPPYVLGEGDSGILPLFDQQNAWQITNNGPADIVLTLLWQDSGDINTTEVYRS